MPNRQHAPRGYELSNAQLSRSMLHNPLRDFLRHLAERDRVRKRWDFESWSDTSDFTMAQTQTSVNFTVVDGLNGIVQGTAVATTTANISMVGKTRWAGNNNCIYEARFNINTIAGTYIIEAGLVDAAPATGASFVTDIDTPSFVGTNGCVFGIWNNQTHTSFAFASVGSFTSQTVASTLITAANASFTTPTAAGWITVKFQLLTDPDETGKTKMYGWVNGILRAKHEAAAGAVNGQGALYPWFYVQAVSAAAKIPQVDYIEMSQDRFALEAASE